MEPEDLLSGLADGLHRLRTRASGALVAKVRRGAPADFFAAEVRGLEAMRATNTLRVPRVLEVRPDALVLEDLGRGRPARSDWESAGVALARMHETRGEAFGFASDGYCGDSVQVNARSSDGHAFFVEHRLLAQAHRAHAAGLLDADDVRRVERIGARLAGLVPDAPPVLVHGDLWLANLHACENGELALIDGAAAHHGWAETDLAMLTLFGEPPAPFFAAYESAANVDARWRDRAPLYNLFHLLNHLNLFGSGYLASVRATLGRYG